MPICPASMGTSQNSKIKSTTRSNNSTHRNLPREESGKMSTLLIYCKSKTAKIQKQLEWLNSQWDVVYMCSVWRKQWGRRCSVIDHVFHHMYDTWRCKKEEILPVFSNLDKELDKEGYAKLKKNRRRKENIRWFHSHIKYKEAVQGNRCWIKAKNPFESLDKEL